MCESVWRDVAVAEYLLLPLPAVKYVRIYLSLATLIIK